MTKTSNNLFYNSLFISILMLYFNSYAAHQSLQIQGNNIKTVRIFKTGNDLSDPIIELNGNETLTLTFDDLSDSSLSYSYTIVHCSSDWKETSIIKSDYLDGFETNPINDYQNSYSTTVPYIHYKLLIPNNDIRIKLSGNYLIRVFDTYNPEKVLLEKKFMVFENLLSLNAKLRQPISSESRSTSQQVELSVSTKTISISNPYIDLVTKIFQNGQPQSSSDFIKPIFIRMDEIDYSSPDNNIFNGVNEFRSFNINSLRFVSSGIQNIEQKGGVYNVLLLPSENNRNQKYSTLNDINGKYRVSLENSNQADIEADYLWVYFTLPYYDQLPEKEVYVYGELTDWQFAPPAQMQYNYQRSAYELRMQLKQGFYNYRYIVKDIKTGEIDQTFFEGNHFETENNYLILVYYKPQGARYDRLVGIKRINSRVSN